MSHPTPALTPAEWLDKFLLCLTQAVAAMGGGNRLANSLIGLITEHIRELRMQVADFAADTAAPIAEGRDVPRHSPAPCRHPARLRPSAPRRPQQKPGRPLPPLPGAVGLRLQLENRFRDLETAAPQPPPPACACGPPFPA